MCKLYLYTIVVWVCLLFISYFLGFSIQDLWTPWWFKVWTIGTISDLLFLQRGSSPKPSFFINPKNRAISPVIIHFNKTFRLSHYKHHPFWFTKALFFHPAMGIFRTSNSSALGWYPAWWFFTSHGVGMLGMVGMVGIPMGESWLIDDWNMVIKCN